jgi:hypothetical protein
VKSVVSIASAGTALLKGEEKNEKEVKPSVE